MAGENPVQESDPGSGLVSGEAAVENHVGLTPPLSSSSSGDPRRRRFESVKGLFVDIFASARISNVDPLRCVSIGSLRSREILKSAVERIKGSIKGSPVGDSLVKGFIATGKFGVVTRIPENFVYLADDHFRERGMSALEAKKMSQVGPLYHVVDGGHVHQALVELVIDHSESFGGFRWPVVVIEWQSPDVLLAISRMCHEIQQDEHRVDFPVPDVMMNLRFVIDTHSRRNGIAVVPGQKLKNGFVNEVVALYTGGQGFASSTLKSLCYIVVRLSSPVVAEMKKLLTEECEDYCRQLGEKRPFSHDSRPYKKLISTQSLKGARFFLDHKAFRDEDRVNVIHRLRFIAREKESFRAFQASQIDEQSRRIVVAQEKIRSFQAFLGENEWPGEMESLRVNMLRTTLVDEEVENHDSDEDSLLPLLTEAYVKATGTHGSQRLRQYKRMKELSQESRRARGSREGVSSSTMEQQNGDEQETELVAQQSSALGRDGRGRSTEANDQPRVQRTEENRESSTPRDEEQCDENITPSGAQAVSRISASESQQVDVEESRVSAMEKCKISLYEKTVMQYEMDTYSHTTVGSFDFVIAEPFQKVPESESFHMDGKDISSFVQCVRRMLIAGGYCLVILDWNKLQEWTSAFATSEMEIVCDPFLIMKDATKFQKMYLRGLQNVYEPAIVARKTGRHPQNFKIDKKSPYMYLSACRMPRWCNVVDGVPPAQGKLTFKPSRALVRPNERNPSLVMELLQTFCPPNGKVLDPFAGALTTGLACVSTERECVLLETDSKCLSLALPRLEKFAESKCSEVSDPLTGATQATDSLHAGISMNESASVGANGKEIENEIVNNQRPGVDQARELQSSDRQSSVNDEPEIRDTDVPTRSANISEQNAKRTNPENEPLMSEVTRVQERHVSSRTQCNTRSPSESNVFMEENSPAPLRRKTRKRTEQDNFQSESERPKRCRKQTSRLITKV